MTRITLKNIIGKKNVDASPIHSLIEQIGPGVWVEDDAGKLLAGTVQQEKKFEFPIKLDDEILGWVKGDEKSEQVASLLSILSQKEAEKKKLGSEVLNLYQEVNLIFNFSERLAQTIEPAAIAQITLDEAGRVIKSDRGVVVMWD
jgi:hypothetical protein